MVTHKIMMQFTRVLQKTVLLSVALIGMSACEHFPITETVKPGKAQMVADPDSVNVMLADAADRAALALETLASVEQKRTPVPAVATIPNAPAELRRGVTVEWNGPAEPMVQALTAQTGYSYQTFGAQPPVPLVIALKTTNRPAIEVFRDIGLQLGGRATLKVDANRRVVELYYAPIGSSPAISGG